MTIRNFIEQKLASYGLWPNEAAQVVKELEADNKEMTGRWDDDASGYPKELMAVLLMVSRSKAVAWIDANNPMHFARHILTMP